MQLHFLFIYLLSLNIYLHFIYIKTELIGYDGNSLTLAKEIKLYVTVCKF